MCWEEGEGGSLMTGGRLYVRTGQHSWNGPIVVSSLPPTHPAEDRRMPLWADTRCCSHAAPLVLITEAASQLLYIPPAPSSPPPAPRPQLSLTNAITLDSG